MNTAAILDRLVRLPRTQRLALYGMLLAVVALVYFVALFLPANSEIDSLRARQAELVTQKRQVEARIKNKSLFDAQLEQLKQDLVQAVKELPNDREIPGLLKGISSLGKKVGLEVSKFQPLPELVGEYVAEVPVSLEVQGSYHEVAMFFDRLSKMNRIVYVQDIEMEKPEERGGKVYLQVTGKAVTFRFLTDEERAAADARAKAKSKGGRGKAKAAPGAGGGE